MESEMVFEWGEVKANANLRDHSVGFDEANHSRARGQQANGEILCRIELVN